MNKLVYRKGHDLLREIQTTSLPKSSAALWNLGQAGFILKSGASDEWIVFDPYLTSSIEEQNPGTEFVREYAPPLEPVDLSSAAAVLITHQHDDHLDPQTVKGLCAVSPQAKIVVPAPHTGLLREDVNEAQIVAAKAGERMFIGQFQVDPIPAAHSAYETDSFGNHLYLGYCVTAGDIRVFHSGDTVVTPELVEAIADFQPHVVLLPINGGDFEREKRGIVGNMGFREAADLAAAVHADLLIPVHYDMFPNNRDNPAYLVDYLFSHHRAQKFHLMAVGERFIYMA